jgi:hypothetical protein
VDIGSVAKSTMKKEAICTFETSAIPPTAIRCEDQRTESTPISQYYNIGKLFPQLYFLFERMDLAFKIFRTKGLSDITISEISISYLINTSHFFHIIAEIEYLNRNYISQSENIFWFYFDMLM